MLGKLYILVHALNSLGQPCMLQAHTVLKVREEDQNLGRPGGMWESQEMFLKGLRSGKARKNFESEGGASEKF